MKKQHKYSQAEIDWLSENYPKLPSKEMAPAFNNRFNTCFSVERLRGTCRRNGISSGRSCRFEKGMIPHNKGKKGVINPGSEKGWFQKGNMPKQCRPVGSERIDIEGYHYVKTKEPRTWRPKHVVLWESVNGSVPKGHIVIFIDKDKNNISISNLELISRKTHAILNRSKTYKSLPVELKRTWAIATDIETFG